MRPLRTLLHWIQTLWSRLSTRTRALGSQWASKSLPPRAEQTLAEQSLAEQSLSEQSLSGTIHLLFQQLSQQTQRQGAVYNLAESLCRDYLQVERLLQRDGLPVDPVKQAELLANVASLVEEILEQAPSVHQLLDAGRESREASRQANERRRLAGEAMLKLQDRQKRFGTLVTALLEWSNSGEGGDKVESLLSEFH